MDYIYPKWIGLDPEPFVQEARDVREQVRQRNINEPDAPGLLPKTKVDDVVVLSSFYGNDRRRYRASLKAMEQLEKTNNMPKYILVEAYIKERDLKDWPSFVHRIPIQIDKYSKGIWLKESLLDIGIREAAKDALIESFLLLDTDTYFWNPSWPIMISDALSQYDVIQPAIFLYTTAGEIKIDYTERHNLSECLPPYCSIGLSKRALESIRYRLPKDQDRSGDIKTTKKLKSSAFRYGIGYQTMVHIEHPRLDVEVGMSRSYKAVFGESLDQEKLIDWDRDIPVWRSKEVAAFVEKLYKGAVK